MPAMSPTMTEGGIANWKKQEGEAFATGDVLLEIVRNLESVPTVIRDVRLCRRRTMYSYYPSALL